ncbi:unnamed protein product [Cyclocybe aegerita]|uniref:Fungal-type protein kinase domain-containing protein n=1 Tax=Cyclocybe aegerita TaxID=1973307 RepID=A0A8S0VVE2_CYCAE|nr:unnamed protein product [Cyclocybe aegerita]
MSVDPEARVWWQQAADEDYFTRVLRNSVFSSDSIEKFVETCSLYDHNAKHWNGIELETPKVLELSAQFLKIFEEVLSTFGIGSQTVINTLAATADNTDFKIISKLFIFGEGSNFNVVTAESYNNNFVNQVANYAWKCFSKQGNRLYVYSLVLGEDEVFLIQYDRNGTLFSNGIDIHNKPEDFIHLILLICSPGCATLGFDTCVYWKGNKRYIKTRGEDNELVEYEVVDSRHFFYRWRHCGHGTERDAEKDLLLELKGVYGIGQIVAHEEQKWTIAMLRGMEGRTAEDGVIDLLFRRTVLEAYGRPIDEFKNRTEFLHAFRDAVAGEVFVVFNRDTGPDASLRLPEHVQEKKSSTAISASTTSFLVGKMRQKAAESDPNFQGTRAFQSIFVLRSELDKKEGRMPLGHDHLDDLESFFYVFCWEEEKGKATRKPSDRNDETIKEVEDQEQRWKPKEPISSAESASLRLLVQISNQNRPAASSANPIDEGQTETLTEMKLYQHRRGHGRD